jgi:hypothetical protein
MPCPSAVMCHRRQPAAASECARLLLRSHWVLILPCCRGLESVIHLSLRLSPPSCRTQSSCVHHPRRTITDLYRLSLPSHLVLMSTPTGVYVPRLSDLPITLTVVIIQTQSPVRQHSALLFAQSGTLGHAPNGMCCFCPLFVELCKPCKKIIVSQVTAH